jgi:hypothetical protein
MPYYTLGQTGFIAVTDVVQITYVNGITLKRTFTLIAQNIIYRATVAKQLVNNLQKEASPFLMELAAAQCDWFRIF